MIHDNWRWQPWYRAARKMISDGHIGSPVSYGFRCRWKDGAGEAPYGTQSYFRDLRRFIIDETLVHHIDTRRVLVILGYSKFVRRSHAREPADPGRGPRDPDCVPHSARDGVPARPQLRRS